MIKIKYLCEYPNYLSKVSKLWYDTIGQKWSPDVSINDVEIRFREHMNKDGLPLTYIALDGEEVVGMCSLRSSDGLKSKYLPWLASLCVEESYRKRGIGKLLTKLIQEKAHKMGFKKLYLFTFEQELVDWYISDGWEKIEDTTYKDLPIVVMSIAV